LSALAALVGLASPGTAAADAATDVCFSAPVEGQKLQRQGRLLDAGGRFSVCASDACPKEISRQCARWVEEVAAAQPSVVVGARDTGGRDLVDVRVSIDGSPAVPIGPRAVPLDPGEHTFVFHREGSPDSLQHVVLREGEKAREVLATLTSTQRDISEPVAGARPEASNEGDRVPGAAWMLGGIGAFAFAGAATFGIWGIVDRSNAGCDTPGGCNAGDKNDVLTKFAIADVALGVGVVASVAALWMYFARPKGHPAAGTVAEVLSRSWSRAGVTAFRF
jgi:hypothetical protein